MTERVRPAGWSLAALAWRRRWWALLVAALVLVGGWAWLASRPGAYAAWVELKIDAERVLRAWTPARATPLAGEDHEDPLLRLLLAEETRAEALRRLAGADQAEAARALALLDPQRLALESLPKSGYRLTVLAEEPEAAGLAVGALAAAFRERANVATRTDWGRVIGDIDVRIRGEERARDAIEGRIDAFEKQNLPVLKEMADLDARLNKLRMMAGDLDLVLLEANAERDLLRRELQVTPPLIAYAVPPPAPPGDSSVATPRSPAASPSLSPSFPGAPGGPGAERTPRPQPPPSALAPSPSSSPLSGLEGVDDRRGLVTMARQRLQQLQTSLDKLRQVYTDQHPDVKIVRRQIDLLRANFPELSRPAKPGRPQPAPAARAVAGAPAGKAVRSPTVGGTGGGATTPGRLTATPGAVPPSRPPSALAGPPVRKAMPATIDNTAVSGPARPNPAYQELAGKLSAREADIARLKARSAKARADAAALEKKAAKGAAVVAELERMDAERRAVQARLDSLSLERNELLAARALDARGERDAVRVLAAPVVSLKPADRGGLGTLERLPWAAGGAGLLAGALATAVARRRGGRTAAATHGADEVGDRHGTVPAKRSSPLLAAFGALAFLAALALLVVGQLLVTQMEAERGLNALVRAAEREGSPEPIEAAARDALAALQAKADALVEGWR